MIGFPSTIGTRHDVEVLLQIFPVETKSYLSSLIDEIPQWYEVELVGEGVTDDTHKVIGNKGIDDVITFTQYELRDNPNAKLFQLGFTVDEVLRL